MGFKTGIEALKHGFHCDVARASSTFQEAAAAKDTKVLAIKGGGVVLGCFLMGKGVYQCAKSLHEPMPDKEKTTLNYNRLFVGAMTAFFGASALYIAALTDRKIFR